MIHHSDPQRALPDAPATRTIATIAEQVDRYRRKRRRRLVAVNAARLRDQTAGRENEFLGFARTWAPYGEPPPDEIFVTFGITLDVFRERVLRALDSSGCEPHIREILEPIYAHNWQTVP